MLRAASFMTITLLMVCCFACTSTEPEAAEETILSKETEGGDTTARVTTLEYLELDLPERHYVVFRQDLSLLDMNGFLAMESDALNKAAKEAKLKTTGPSTSLFYEWDTDRGWGDAAVALPVAAGASLPPYVTIALPPQKAIALELDGPYDGLSAMHYALDAELKRRGLTAAKPSIEEYTVGPLDTKDPTQFKTRLIYTYENPEK
ncbi:GyrI-like domain-containing protein [Neolewinella agarilytica]|uniref:GyrI-like domain-containing protein n=1 Tax=Neolewinella agarilytica TaxID=478744 RepID=UPI002356F1B0|nr:GyrI-like domain-containing protein [Neolewinella agarilytica]